MESTQQGSSSMGTGKGKKIDKTTRRSWTPKEEESLITALKELVAQRQKTPNGWKAGYLTKLEDALRNSVPGTDLRGNPHIVSKLSTWKKFYGSLTQMLGRSGVGFNAVTCMIECDDDQWENIVKADNNARGMRYKSWPFLNDWKDIFGADRANGESVMDFPTAVDDMERDKVDNPDENVGGDYYVSLDDIYETNNGENSVCQSQPTNEVPKQKGKKRKSTDGIETVCALLGEINRNTNSSLDNLAKSVGYDQVLGQARKEVFDKLGNIPGLSLDEKLDICDILADKVERLEVFMGLPDEARGVYVRRLLNGK